MKSWRAAWLGLVAGAMMAGCATPQPLAAETPKPQPTQAAETATPPPKPTVSEPTRVPTQAPTPAVSLTPSIGAQQILDLAYNGSLWVLGATAAGGGQALTVFRTDDGGVTWQSGVIPGGQPAYVGESGQTGKASRVAFVDQKVGWVYGPGLFQTTDGGQTWQPVTVKEEVAGIAAPVTSAGNAWMLSAACTGATGCTYSLRQFDAATRAWSPAPGAGSFTAAEHAGLVRTGDQAGYVLTGVDTPTPHTRIWRTEDDGQTWSALDAPCAAVGKAAAAPEGRLWLLCGGGPGAGSQLKQLYFSQDQAGSWQAVKTSDGSSTVPTAGYVDDLLALPGGRLLAGLGRYTLLLSDDAGQTWKPVIPADGVAAWGSGWRILQAAGPDDLWASIGALLFKSTDGGQSWSQINY